ncbi:MAG: 5-formyltetrahydrofolate cyclo-ligase [Methylobacterium mesophilicum]|nr:5-formyltetrahydrofolate cyclo-ligase [Methylobacterium mesophilicum]
MSVATGDSRQIKKGLRAEALGRRDALDAGWRAEASLGLAQSGASAIRFAPGTVVSGFWPMRSEFDVRPLMARLGEMGARLCLPAILDKTTIVFRTFHPERAMVEMSFGTHGPDEDAAVLDPAIMLVPLAAFDRRGHRIGYGAGYYDRAIAALEQKGIMPLLFGIAFDCQEVDQVPDEPHDIPLPALLSESGLRRFPDATR